MTLNSREQLKLDIISRLVNNKITIKDAIRLLNISSRTVYRYKADYIKNGVLSIKHGNHRRVPSKKYKMKKGKDYFWLST